MDVVVLDPPAPGVPEGERRRIVGRRHVREQNHWARTSPRITNRNVIAAPGIAAFLPFRLRLAGRSRITAVSQRPNRAGVLPFKRMDRVMSWTPAASHNAAAIRGGLRSALGNGGVSPVSPRGSCPRSGPGMLSTDHLVCLFVFFLMMTIRM